MRKANCILGVLSLALFCAGCANTSEIETTTQITTEAVTETTTEFVEETTKKDFEITSYEAEEIAEEYLNSHLYKLKEDITQRHSDDNPIASIKYLTIGETSIEEEVTSEESRRTFVTDSVWYDRAFYKVIIKGHFYGHDSYDRLVDIYNFKADVYVDGSGYVFIMGAVSTWKDNF